MTRNTIRLITLAIAAPVFLALCVGFPFVIVSGWGG